MSEMDYFDYMPSLSGPTETLLWCAGMLLLVVVASVVLMRVRHKYRPGPDSGGESSDFGIEQLEVMLDDGHISLEEFRVLRRSALGLDCGARSDDNRSSSVGGSDDDESTSDG